MVRRTTALVVAALFVVGCTSSGSVGSTTSSSQSPTTTDVPRLEWSPCAPGTKSPLCATLKVPFDYENPSLGSFSLKVVKRPAGDPGGRIGSLLVNPGGPGYGGSYLAESAESFFSGDLLARFDIVGWDPRGTGESTPAVDCIDEYDPYFALDPTPETPVQKQALIDASAEFNRGCSERSGAILAHISTNNTARDMDTLRRALGEDTISYFGFSYGSELGATWTTMFPDTVRAAVLDGSVDPSADYMEEGVLQAKGFENELTKFLALCSDTPSCPFHSAGNAERAFDDLMESLDSSPLKVSANRAPVNQAVALNAVAQAMYSSSMWGSLEQALADARRGDGAGLLDLNDQYYERAADGTYGNELEAFLAISCIDSVIPDSVEEADKSIPRVREVAPRLWPVFTSQYSCHMWPAPADPRIDITGAGAGPIVVVGTTGDAATPLAGTRAMAGTLQDGRLIVVSANQHTGYGANACVVGAVDDYLITGEVDFSEKSC